jgi:glycine dehydrogenase
MKLQGSNSKLMIKTHLIEQTIPASIRSEKPLSLSEPVSEHRFLKNLSEIAKKNKLFKSYIGMGYYDTITPPVIQRNILENPGWYTQYTPYQPEIAQGRLEALLNFQTMVSDLTKMDVANASLLDEATAAAEAMTMVHGIVARSKPNANKFLVCDSVECRVFRHAARQSRIGRAHLCQSGSATRQLPLR